MWLLIGKKFYLYVFITVTLREMFTWTFKSRRASRVPILNRKSLISISLPLPYKYKIRINKEIFIDGTDEPTQTYYIGRIFSERHILSPRGNQYLYFDLHKNIYLYEAHSRKIALFIVTFVEFDYSVFRPVTTEKRQLNIFLWVYYLKNVFLK